MLKLYNYVIKFIISEKENDGKMLLDKDSQEARPKINAQIME